MLYCFEVRGDYLAYDNESGALLFVDRATHAILKAYDAFTGKKPGFEKLNQIADEFHLSPELLVEISEEIDALISNKTLFKEAEPVVLKQLYPTEPRIKSMCLHLCHDCNLRCRYCFAETGDFGTGKRSMLSEEIGKKAIDFLIHASGPRKHLDIDFFGGEPLMNWPVVLALTEYCEKEGPKHNKIIRLTMTTNCVLLDDEKMNFLNEHMKNIVLSIDGRREINDFMRPRIGGQGSYDSVMKNIKEFVKLRGDKEHYIRGTITAHNLDFTNDVLHLVEEGIKQISLEPVVAPGSRDYALREEHLPQLFDEYERLAVAYLESRKSSEPFQFFHFNVDLEGGPCLYKRMKGCGVGTEYCAVTPDGDIYPCHQFVGEEAFLMGNVLNTPALNVSDELKEHFSRLILPNKDHCQSCWAKYFCSGGCAANAYHASASLEGIYELGCQLQRKRLELALWVQAKKKEFSN